MLSTHTYTILHKIYASNGILSNRSVLPLNSRMKLFIFICTNWNWIFLSWIQQKWNVNLSLCQSVCIEHQRWFNGGKRRPNSARRMNQAVVRLKRWVMGHQSNYQHNQSTPFIQPASLCSQLFGCAQVKKTSAVSRCFQSEARVAFYSARRNSERLCFCHGTNFCQRQQKSLFLGPPSYIHISN